MVKSVVDLIKSWKEFVSSVKATPEELNAVNDAADAAAARLSARYHRPGSNVTTISPRSDVSMEHDASLQEGEIPASAITGVKQLTAANDDLAVSQKKIELNSQQIYNNLKRDTDALGIAATDYDRYHLALTKVDSDMSDQVKALTAEQGARVKSALGVQYHAQQTQALVGALGAVAGVQDHVAAAQAKLAEEQQRGISLTDRQKAAIIDLAQRQADGTFALQAQIDATRVQTATIGMSVGAAEAYSVVQGKINENINAGRPALDGVTEGFKKLAAAAGEAKQAQAELKAQNDATFQAETVFFGDTEKSIANVQKSLHGDAWKEFMNDGLSSTMRVTSAIEEASKAGQSFVTDFVGGMLSGKNATDSLVASLSNLATMMGNAAIKDAFAALGEFAKGDTAGAMFDGVKAAIEGAIAIGSKVLGSNIETTQQKQQEQQATQNAQALLASLAGGSGALQMQTDEPAQGSRAPTTERATKARRSVANDNTLKEDHHVRCEFYITSRAA